MLYRTPITGMWNVGCGCCGWALKVPSLFRLVVVAVEEVGIGGGQLKKVRTLVGVQVGMGTSPERTSHSNATRITMKNKVLSDMAHWVASAHSTQRPRLALCGHMCVFKVIDSNCL